MFSHLHVHSTYSILDGIAKIEELIVRAKELGQTSIAITDHGSTSGLWQAQKLGKKHGVKIILGTEFYYERENDGGNGHLVVLAKNNKGLESLLQLQEFAYVDNFYKKPRINWEMLKKHKEGLIVSSACLASTFAQHLMEGQYDEAMEWASKFKQEFGDDFYLEIQPNKIPEQWEVNKHTIAIARKLDIKFIATNDVHYVLETDVFPHEVQLAMQVGKKMSDEKRFRFTTDDFWLRSEDEMKEAFIGISDEDVQIALDTTQEIVDKSNAEFIPGRYLPTYYDVPKGKTSREVLVEKVKEGLKTKKYKFDLHYMSEVQHEIDVIDEEGYSDYFLIVQDYVNSAKARGEVVGDGRGSGAGSKVVYLTGITQIEPNQFGLLFERFMAKGREPDIDSDFSDQDSVFADLQSKYGERNVARIVAFGTMTPKAVCRKVFSTFDYPTAIVNSISKLIPDLCPSLKEAYIASPELLKMKDKYRLEFSVIERLEGTISHESQHAGGVIIYDSLSKHLPIKTVGEDRSKRIVAFDMDMIHELGYFKFDILGLITISIIRETVKSVEAMTGEIIDLYAIDYEDEKIYNMLSQGHVSGVFQLANQAQKVMEQNPKNFRDLIAINALIRPGVGDWHEYISRRQGKEWCVHPDRAQYLNETQGTMTYQEQYLLDCRVIAGWDIAYADKHVRKNYDIKNDTELKEKFISDSMERGYEKDLVEQIWREIEDAVDGGYSFNKSHSASYAMTSFQTAYLKYYYPEHFYAATMSAEKTDAIGQSAISSFIAESKQRGITILPPDINKSTERFVVTEKGVAYRITTITHVGESAIKHINSLRPIASFEDFMMRRNKSDAKANVVRNLIKAGCFDFDNDNRAELLWEFEQSQRTNKQVKDGYECDKYEWNDTIKSQWEKEVLGMYLTSHPLEKYGFVPFDKFEDGGMALQGGEIVEVRLYNDKNGNEMAFVNIDTLFGLVKTTIFSSTWKDKKLKEATVLGNIVLVKGKRSGNSILVDKIEVLE